MLPPVADRRDVPKHGELGLVGRIPRHLWFMTYRRTTKGSSRHERLRVARTAVLCR
jgi:hypothetical protein